MWRAGLGRYSLSLNGLISNLAAASWDIFSSAMGSWILHEGNDNLVSENDLIGPLDLIKVLVVNEASELSGHHYRLCTYIIYKVTNPLVTSTTICSAFNIL
eukprot:TRINITY_DN9557_c0_g4_i1.p1 TRINITY_DN9557_c0_g4~~TRINITY_DN9557_c0_g4_i1.p1  ORF type:complete len:101 (+),score=8.38 TRINITY_DN9557_c0_g4_i1:96-398(+)